MVDTVEPSARAGEDSPGTVADKPLLVRALRAFGRRLLRAVQESQRRRAAMIVRENTHLGPSRSDGDRDA